jgi:hypothetical protein
MKNNEFVSDHVIQAAKKNLEVSAEHGGTFVPVAITDTGEVFLMNRHDNKQRAFEVMGMVAWMKKFQYVVYVLDTRVRVGTEEEKAMMEAGRGREIKPGPMSEQTDEALVFMVMPFSSEVKGATGMWKYVRLGGCIGWEGKAPHFEPQIWTETGFYKWTIDGYRAAEKMGLRPANERKA